jgi:hypothetical protein
MVLDRRLRPLALAAALVAGCGGAATPSPEPSPALQSASPSPTGTATASPSGTPLTTSAPPTNAPPPEWAEIVPQLGDVPAAREDHTWTLDPSSGVAYLFGGRDGGPGMDDLWSYDLIRNSWVFLPSIDTPPGRFGHEAAWVDGIGLVIWAGQANATTFLDDLWAYEPDANVWRELPQGGAHPVARYGSCSGIGPDGRLWISHGFTADTGRFADTWAYDFAAETWTDETPDGRGPVERCLHGCWWTDDGRFVLYAGQTTGVTALDDLWVLDDPGAPTAAWRLVDLERPPARNLYAFARAGASTVVAGGLGNDGYLDDAFRLDDGALVATPVDAVAGPPPARAGAAMVADPAGESLYLFGGRDDDGARVDLWSLIGQ